MANPAIGAVPPMTRFSGYVGGSWAILHQMLDSSQPSGPAYEAARKLIMNHESLLHDVTNPKPYTQLDLPRVGFEHKQYVDQMLRDVARRLLGRAPEEPMDQISAAAGTGASHESQYRPP